jgi:hypothetical protein
MSRRTISIGISALVIGGLAVTTVLAQDDGASDAEPVTEEAEPNPTVEPAPPEVDPFALSPADEGAVTWDDMTPEDRAGVEAIQDWAENGNGAATHNAFAAAVATTDGIREVEAAQTASGLDGIETLGVVP